MGLIKLAVVVGKVILVCTTLEVAVVVIVAPLVAAIVVAVAPLVAAVVVTAIIWVIVAVVSLVVGVSVSEATVVIVVAEEAVVALVAVRVVTALDIRDVGMWSRSILRPQWLSASRVLRAKTHVVLDICHQLINAIAGSF